MREGLSKMASGDFRVEKLKTKTFGVVCMIGIFNPLISVKDNSSKWRSKIDKITSSAEYDVVRVDK